MKDQLDELIKGFKKVLDDAYDAYESDPRYAQGKIDAYESVITHLEMARRAMIVVNE